MNFQAMRSLLYSGLLIPLIACSTGEKEVDKEEASEHEVQDISNAMGHFLYENLKSQQLPIDIDSLIQGIRDAQGGSAAPFTKQQFAERLSQYKNNIQQVKSAENLRIAEDFLEENQLEPHVVSLEGGKVQYRVLEEGQGIAVSESSEPVINYEGRLIDGTVFDSTSRRGEPATLPLKATILGFKKGVAGMKEGEKRRLYIHPAMGYGTQGGLPPNSLLIFDIELVEAGSQPDAEEESDESPQETGSRWMEKIRKTIF